MPLAIDNPDISRAGARVIQDLPPEQRLRFRNELMRAERVGQLSQWARQLLRREITDGSV